MGATFSNIHVKKNAALTPDDLARELSLRMTARGLIPSDSPEDSDITAVVYSPENSEWITIASDIEEFTDYDSIKSVSGAYCTAFGTPVIGALCIDSDFMGIGLFCPGSAKEGWINIGKPYSGKMLHRTALSEWKKAASDGAKLETTVKREYVCAEEAFCEIAELIDMAKEQCTMSADCAADEGVLLRLYWKLPPTMEKDPPKFEIHFFHLDPCRMDEENCVHALNVGGKSKGIRVIITGDFVENDELVFENITFESELLSPRRKSVPIELEKVRSGSGYILVWEDKNFRIPPAVDPKLPWKRKMDIEGQRLFGVRFTLRGNRRKRLDVKIFFVPLENYQNGADCWYCWRHSGSKRQFIDDYNEPWNEHLDPDDFDL